MDLLPFLTQTRLVEARPGLKLPLARVGLFPRRGGAHFLPTKAGVVVGADERLILYDPELRSPIWEHPVPERASFVCTDDILLYGGVPWPKEEHLVAFDLKTGAVRKTAPVPHYAFFVGLTGSTVAMRVKEAENQYAVCVFDRRTLKEIWRRPSHPELSHAPSAGERYLAPTKFGLSLQCLDAATGTCLWEFAPPGGDPKIKPPLQPNRIGGGFPSVAVAGERVIVTTFQEEVFSLAVENGEQLAHGKPPFRGAYLVTATSMFFAQAYGLSEFDHHQMREVSRVEYRREVEPLYKGQPPTVNGFWLTEDSVIWTTMHGAFMGVGRTPEGGKRVTWGSDVDALMPIGQSPLGHGDYLYYSVVARDRESPQSGLHCYRSSASGA